MLRFEGNRGVTSCNGITRRDFLRVGSLAVGLSLAELAQLKAIDAAPRHSEKAVIQLFLVGGPSQLETWDLKPNAPDHVRGPFRPIATNVPGIQISEHFPRMARMADRYAVLRSVHHPEAPIHETGHQLLQTGRLTRNGLEYPHYGATIGKMRPSAVGVPSWVVLPQRIGNTGVNVSHGQTAGFLGGAYEAFVPPAEILVADRRTSHGLDPSRSALLPAVDATHRALDQAGATEADAALASLLTPQAKQAFDLAAEPDSVRARYGWNTFGQSCLLARRLIEHGVRLATVNMFDTVFGQLTWDCHANGGDLGTTLDDYRDTLCPMFDVAYSALLDDLSDRGLLENTLVVSTGEFGRTPKLNNRNGRDHWPACWSMLLAGGGIRGGQVLGSSDAHAEEPKDRPIHAAEIAATVYHAMGINPRTTIPGPDGRLLPLLDAAPVLELF